ncbi:MAG: amino acid adenylation domain-containing protein [Acidobacteria bacterium]|nr:amino acid adenylation domain-containing protein [Acidobacteriota bacterium]
MAPPLVAQPREGAAPLSFAQQRLWFLDQLAPGSPVYNLPLAVRIDGALDIAALARSFAAVVQRHEALRTVFGVAGEGGEPRPVARLLPPAPFALPVVDLGPLAPARREEAAAALAAVEAGQPFDLARGPLLRIRLLRLAAEDHVVLLTMHHIVSDGWSMGILLGEVTALYVAYSSFPAPAASLPELPVQYADYARWQRDWLQGEVLANELAYWREQLAGAPPVLTLPADHPRPAVREARGASRDLRLPAALTEGLRALGRSGQATLFMTLLAGFQAFLARLSGQDDVLVGTVVAGRRHQEVEGLIGFFVNTLVLRADLSRDPSPRQLLAAARETSLAAHAHQDLPFERLVEEVAPERSLSHSPLFQVMLSFQNTPAGKQALGDLRMQPFARPAATAKFDLTLALEELDGELAGVLDYDAALFDRETVARWAEQLQRLLAGAVAAPERPFSELPLLGAAEQAQVARDWNAAAPGLSGEMEEAAAPVHAQVLAWATAHPAALALVSPRESLSYGRLQRRAARLARRLSGLGVGPEVRVGLCLERSADAVVAMLAVLAAGGAYVPLDPAYPQERLEFMLRDCGATVLLTRESLSARCAGFGGTVLFLHEGEVEDEGEEGSAPETPAAAATHPDHLAYVVYTSGTTGRPKGVAISHRGLVNLVAWHRRTYGLGAGDRTTHLAAPGFDAAVWEVWSCLAAGATLHLPDDATRAEPERLRDWLLDSQVTVAFLPTPMAERVVLLPWPEQAPLRTVLTGGDRLRTLPPAGLPFALVNHYGPSESSVVATCARVDPRPPTADVDTAPPIGCPIDHTRVLLLDRWLAPVPPGSAGELCIAGAGLARGYLGRPDLTAERFLPSPLAAGDGAGERLYRTGDLARYRRDGNLEFLGRVDDQVKLRGFRIEVGEIEAVLARHPAVARTAVVPREERAGEVRLIAWVVPRVGAAVPGAAELRRFLGETLPEFMLPAAFATLPELPLTRHGKVDRAALARLAPQPGLEDDAVPGEALAPRDEVELRLVRLWEDLLGRRAIGVRDSFFELGGHSLLAVELFTAVERTFGQRIALSALFRQPTVEHLAAEIRRRPAASRSLLVELQPDGSRPPVFLVHAAGGNVFCYVQLVRHLGAGQPVYSFRASGLEGREVPRRRLDTMAAAYVAELLAFQPRGPYRLAGWSLGGLIAWEMARQLAARGHAVEPLVLLDSWAAPPPAGDETLLATFAADLGLDPARLAPQEAEEMRRLDEQARLARLLEWGRRAGVLPLDFSLERLRRFYRVFQANARASQNYQPRPGVAPAPVVLVKAASHAGAPPADPSLGWSPLATAGLTLHEVPGDHFSMIRAPHVEHLVRFFDSSKGASL